MPGVGKTTVQQLEQGQKKLNEMIVYPAFKSRKRRSNAAV